MEAHKVESAPSETAAASRGAHESAALEPAAIERFVAEKWDDEIVPQLVEYIRIPNKSPMFDADWVANGYMADAVKLMEGWARAQSIPARR
jgi:hypothetical protein